jgi:hypothetical protein
MSMLVGAVLHRVQLEHQPATGPWLEGVVVVLTARLSSDR